MKTIFSNIVPLMDGARHPAGHAPDVTLECEDTPAARYAAVVKYLTEHDWDFNGVTFTATSTLLEKNDMELILAALTSVTPSGGGGTLNSLVMKLSEAWGIPMYSYHQMILVRRMCSTVIEDAKECGAV
jgi:hypothetical protein